MGGWVEEKAIRGDGDGESSLLLGGKICNRRMDHIEHALGR